MAADFIRGLRWRAALTIVAALLVIGTLWASSGSGYLLRVDFTYAIPEAFGADVIVDGVTLDTLKMLRRQPVNGIRVPNGEHVLVIESEQCIGIPLTITPVRREKTISVFVNLQERTVDGRFRCMFQLRR